jgi:hypothetical protein
MWTGLYRFLKTHSASPTGHMAGGVVVGEPHFVLLLAVQVPFILQAFSCVDAVFTIHAPLRTGKELTFPDCIRKETTLSDSLPTGMCRTTMKLISYYVF